MRRLIIAIGLISFCAIGSPCEQVYSETPLVTSGALDSAPPTAVSAFKTAAINECNAALRAGESGLSLELMTSLVVESVDVSSPTFSSLLLATRLQMVTTGWAIGAESK